MLSVGNVYSVPSAPENILIKFVLIVVGILSALSIEYMLIHLVSFIG